MSRTGFHPRYKIGNLNVPYSYKMKNPVELKHVKFLKGLLNDETETSKGKQIFYCEI